MIFDSNDEDFFENSPLSTGDVNRWVERNLPSFAEMERVTRSILDMHGDKDEDWDGLHAFVLYERVPGTDTVEPAVMMGIVPTIDPSYYPSVLTSQTQQFLGSRIHELTEKPVVACALMIEAFTLERPPTEEERELIDAGKLHTISDASEKCIVTVVDIAGRVWHATKTRNDPDSIVIHDNDVFATYYGRLPNMMRSIMGATSALHALAEMV